MTSRVPTQIDLNPRTEIESLLQPCSRLPRGERIWVCISIFLLSIYIPFFDYRIPRPQAIKIPDRSLVIKSSLGYCKTGSVATSFSHTGAACSHPLLLEALFTRNIHLRDFVARLLGVSVEQTSSCQRTWSSSDAVNNRCVFEWARTHEFRSLPVWTLPDRNAPIESI